MDAQTIQTLANQRRADAITMIRRANTGHTGGAMSSLDILSVLYYDVLRIRPNEPNWPDRDRFLLSKGHSVEGYLALLADRGFIQKDELRTFSQAGSRLIGHPNNSTPGVEVCTGALGHGLPVGVGMALAAKRTERPYRAFVLMGDGEQARQRRGSRCRPNLHLDNSFCDYRPERATNSGSPKAYALENSKKSGKIWGGRMRAVAWTRRALQFSHRAKEGQPPWPECPHVKAKGDFAENRKVGTTKCLPRKCQEACARLGERG